MSEHLAWMRFADLTGALVHDLFRLRQDVFVVEQRCAFGEIDGRDVDADHLLATRSGDLAGCLRLLPEDGGIRIGRIAVARGARGSGLGHRLVGAALARCAAAHAGCPLVLSAQAHLQRFYGTHGFIAASPLYLEDGIWHVDMRRAA